MRHALDCPTGTIVTDNPWLDREIIREVIVEDCYKLRQLATVYQPKILFDVGMGCGTVSLLAKTLWPDIKITGFESDPHIAATAKANLPDAMIVNEPVGYKLRARELTDRYGYADLLCIDCEGGEVPFFYDLFTMGTLTNFPVICGEYHQWPGRRLLEACLQERYHIRFVNPADGAGPWCYFFATHQGLPIEIPRAWGV